MECLYCNKEHNRRKFCSDYCKNEWHKKTKRDKNRKLLEQKPIEPRECKNCRNKFRPTRRCNKNQVFCNKDCKTEFFSNKNKSITKSKRMCIKKECPICGKEFSPEKTTKQKYCSRKCCYLIPKKCYKALQTCLNYLDKEKNDRTHKMLGFSPEMLINHLNSFDNWEDVKDKDWHLDHIFPIIAFVENGIEDISIICSLENLRPILAEDNCKKNKSYDKEEFNNWIKSKLY